MFGFLREFYSKLAKIFAKRSASRKKLSQGFGVVRDLVLFDILLIKAQREQRQEAIIDELNVEAKSIYRSFVRLQQVKTRGLYDLNSYR